MPNQDDLLIEVDHAPGPPAGTSGRLVRQASLSSVVGAVILAVVIVIATSMRQPGPSDAPAGAAGMTQPPGPTEPPESWIAVTPTAAPSESPGTSAEEPSSTPAHADPTPWKTSPPSGCHPYIKACDPTIQPTYPYVSLIMTTDGNTDADIGIGKVKVVADGHTFACTTFSSPASCYWEVPPGTPVVATVFTQPGSVCMYFELMWEDHTAVRHDDCSPMSFTQRTQKAQLTTLIDRAPTQPPATPTAPPLPVVTPTPEPTPQDTPLPS